MVSDDEEEKKFDIANTQTVQKEVKVEEWQTQELPHDMETKLEQLSIFSNSV